MKKSTFVWIGIFALWFTLIGRATTGIDDPSLGRLFGEFIGSFIFIYACVWVMAKVKNVLKNLLSKKGIKKPAQ